VPAGRLVKLAFSPSLVSLTFFHTSRYILIVSFVANEPGFLKETNVLCVATLVILF